MAITIRYYDLKVIAKEVSNNNNNNKIDRSIERFFVEEKRLSQSDGGKTINF